MKGEQELHHGYGTPGAIDDIMSRLAIIGGGTNTYASYKYLGAARIVEEDYQQARQRAGEWGELMMGVTPVDEWDEKLEEYVKGAGLSDAVAQDLRKWIYERQGRVTISKQAQEWAKEAYRAAGERSAELEGDETDHRHPRLRPGEAVPPQFQPGGPSDFPASLPGKWKVSICAGGGHAWIRYESLETGEVHTTGRYKLGFGGRMDENGNVIVPPAAVSGVQWDRELMKEPGLKQGTFEVRSVIVEDPKIFTGRSQFGYSDWGNNCTTHARDAWYFYSGEYKYLPGPDLPSVLEAWIKDKNNPPRLPPDFDPMGPDGMTFRGRLIRPRP